MPNDALRCPALFVAAPASGQGKTTVTAALARLHRRRGRSVRVFKCGPDFLDPQIHAVASGAPVHNVDLGMCGEADIAWRLHRAAGEAELILVEGVMGLYDGAAGEGELASTAQVAIRLEPAVEREIAGVPVVVELPEGVDSTNVVVDPPTIQVRLHGVEMLVSQASAVGLAAVVPADFVAGLPAGATWTVPIRLRGVPGLVRAFSAVDSVTVFRRASTAGLVTP